MNRKHKVWTENLIKNTLDKLLPTSPESLINLSNLNLPKDMLSILPNRNDLPVPATFISNQPACTNAIQEPFLPKVEQRPERIDSDIRRGFIRNTGALILPGRPTQYAESGQELSQ